MQEFFKIPDRNFDEESSLDSESERLSSRRWKICCAPVPSFAPLSPVLRPIVSRDRRGQIVEEAETEMLARTGYSRLYRGQFSTERVVARFA